MATAYFSYSARLLSEAARILGNESDRKYYDDIAEKAAMAYCWEYIEQEGGVNSNRQCRYIRPIALQVASKEQQSELAKELNQMIIDNNYLANTGFLSTQFILPVLCDFGYVETAYRMAINEERGSWLYQPKHGATTVWEGWYSEHSGNHYSLGSMVGWLYKYVAGIRPMEPGFKKVLIKPFVNPLLNNISCTYNSISGKILVEWKISGGFFEISIDVPVPTVLIMPNGTEYNLNKGVHKHSCNLN